MSRVKIFLSWSGEVSNYVASVLKEWIPYVLPYTDPFFSPEDIKKGSRSLEKIKEELEASDFGILCLTPENYSKPWINFEAGALSNRFGIIHVCPIVIGLEPTEVKGPVTQFQMATTERMDIFKMIKDINEIEKGDSVFRLDQKQLENSFSKNWPDLEPKLKQAHEMSLSEKTASVERSASDMLVELLEISRDIRNNMARKKLSDSIDLEAILNEEKKRDQIRAAIGWPDSSPFNDGPVGTVRSGRYKSHASAAERMAEQLFGNHKVLEAMEEAAKVDPKVLRAMEEAAKIDPKVLRAMEAAAKIDPKVLRAMEEAAKVDPGVSNAMGAAAQIDSNMVKAAKEAGRVLADRVVSIKKPTDES